MALIIPESWFRKHPIYREMKERLQAEIATLRSRPPTDQSIRHSGIYRTMKNRLNAEIERLNSENAQLRSGIMEEMTPSQIRAHPLYQELRERHKALAEKNQDLRRQVSQTAPSKYWIQRSDEYRALKQRHDELLDELRSAKSEARKGKWLEDAAERYRLELAALEERTGRFLPVKIGDAKEAARWHLMEAARWAHVGNLSLYVLKGWLTSLEKDDCDPTRDARARFGAIPVALRRELLFEASCANCARNDDLSIDHIIPIAAGGRSNRENLQVLCRSCNSKKGARISEAI